MVIANRGIGIDNRAAGKRAVGLHGVADGHVLTRAHPVGVLQGNCEDIITGAIINIAVFAKLVVARGDINATDQYLINLHRQARCCRQTSLQLLRDQILNAYIVSWCQADIVETDFKLNRFVC